MTSNFEELRPEWNEIYDDARQSEMNAKTAPRTSVFYARRTAELMIQWMYAYDKDLKKPYEDHLSALLFEPSFRRAIPTNLFHLINYIRKIGNQAVHTQGRIQSNESYRALRNLHLFYEWFVSQYSKESVHIVAFDDALIPVEGGREKDAEELHALLETMEAKDHELKVQRQLLDDTRQELDKLRDQFSQTKARNAHRIPHNDYSEAETRTLFIDLLLREAGWDPKGDKVAEYEVKGMPNDQGLGYVDYVLWGDDGLPLGLVEAKRTTEDPNKGKRQAELYADCLEAMHGQRPIIFYTNGYDHWIWDDKNYPPRAVLGFYTKDELQTMIHRRSTQTDIRTAKPNEKITGRYYQKLAIQSVLERFAQKERKSLLVMATGTGKTRVAVSLTDVLMQNNWVKNVLFLADRTALIKQAKNVYNDLLPQATTVDVTKDKEDTTSRVVFSTYPTMMNLIDESKKDGEKRFGVGHFDLIIIDEAHRSVYQKYRAIFEYFDSLLIGLTATPKAEIDHNTYELFDSEDNNPTYAYELDTAVKDKFLVPAKQIEVPTKFLSTGLTYDELTAEEKEEYEASFEDEEGQLPLTISAASFNDWLFNIDTVDKVIAHVMEHGIKVHGGDDLGKSIIFAKNHKHALFIEERFNKNYPYFGGKGLRVIDNYVKYADTLIDAFSSKKKDAPFLAVSVDMLDTGIDIPEIVNLVFFKMVRSKSKFWQMIGRGTRLCQDLFALGEDKQEFLIFDFCGNFSFFDVNPEGIKTSAQKPLSQQLFELRTDLIFELQKRTSTLSEEDKVLHGQLIEVLHTDVEALDANSFQLRAHKRFLDAYSVRAKWDNLTGNDLLDIKEHVAPYSNLIADEDEFAKRFDLLLLALQLEKLGKHSGIPNIEKRITLVATLLQEKANIPAVAAKLESIQEIVEERFFESASISILEKTRLDLRDLIKLLDPPDRKTVYTNFKDTLYGNGVRTNPLVGDKPKIDYYKRVQSIIQENLFDPVVLKIKRNQVLTSEDITGLEDLIIANAYDIEKQKLEETFLSQPLGEFIRSIVGLDRKAALDAFSDFIQSHSLNPAQLHFINEVVDHVTRLGFLEPGKLYDQPFRDFHFEGVDGLFERNEKEEIVSILSRIRENARVIV